MKRLLLFIALLFSAMLTSIPTPSVTSAADATKKERAVMTFNQPVILLGVTLKGAYLFVHDDAAMARGDACTYVYKGNAEIRKNLVVSFHCKPAERAKADHFTTRAVQTSGGLYQLTEFQFNGSTEAHLVPAPVD